HEHGVVLAFIDPGKPMQNAVVESFNGRMRDECLDVNWWSTIDDARRGIGAHRIDYNEVRPHGALNNRTPSEFARELRDRDSGVGPGRSHEKLGFKTNSADSDYECAELGTRSCRLPRQWQHPGIGPSAARSSGRGCRPPPSRLRRSHVLIWRTPGKCPRTSCG